MSEHLQYQLRAYLDDPLAATARHDPASAALAPLLAALRRHDATLVCQLDAFEAYVAEAEREGAEADPLYRWTKATLADPTKRAKHARAFAVRVGGSEVYGREQADALEAELQDLVGAGLVQRISRHDTDPANNLPIPPEYRSV